MRRGYKCTVVTSALAALLAGCDGAPAAGGDVAATVQDAQSAGDAEAAEEIHAPTPWIYPAADEPIAPSLTADERAQALGVALDAALTLTPEAVRALHDLLLPPPSAGQGDLTSCPFVLTYDYGTTQAFYWQGECVAADGTRFSGQGSAAWMTDAPTEGLTTNGFTYTLSGRIEAADGTYLEAAGEASAYVGLNSQLRAFGRALDGSFRAGGPRAPQSAWLTGERRPSLHVDGWVYLPTGGRNLVFSGGVGGLTGFPGGVTAVAFDGLTLRSLLAGATCGKEPGGGASIRGPDGNWFDVSFDGPVEAEPSTPSALCDTCGRTWFRGVATEPTCKDTDSYLQWPGDAPW